jgi:hypothetical protein
LKSGFDVQILELNMVQPELLSCTLDFALEWQEGKLHSIELPSSWGNHDLLASLGCNQAVANMKVALVDVMAAEAAARGDVVPEQRDDVVPELLPPPPPAPGPSMKRERADDDYDDDDHSDGYYLQQSRNSDDDHSDGYHQQPNRKSWKSSSTTCSVSGLSLDDLEMIDHWQLDGQATKNLKALALDAPEEKSALVRKLQKKAACAENLRNPSAFVITCCKNAMGHA